MALSPTSSRAAAASSAETLLCSQVLAGAQATFDTNAAALLSGAIPATYNHLRIVLLARDDGASNSITSVGMQFNADTAANYDTDYVNGSAATLVGAAVNAGTSVFGGIITQGGGSAGLFTQSEVLIGFYHQTTARKVVTGAASSIGAAGTASGDFRPWIWMGNWRSTAAITRIVMTPAAGNFAIGSAFYLYGVT